MSGKARELTLTVEEQHRVLDHLVAGWILHHPGRSLRKASIMDLLDWHARVLRASEGEPAS